MKETSNKKLLIDLLIMLVYYFIGGFVYYVDGLVCLLTIGILILSVWIILVIKDIKKIKLK